MRLSRFAVLGAGWFLLGCSTQSANTQAADGKAPTPVYIKLEVEDFGNMGSYKKAGATWSPRMAWYPQWSRGGDSGWWAAQGDPKATSGELTMDCFVPVAGQYNLWVRYEDYHGKPEPFDVIVKHTGGEERGEFGRQDTAAAQAGMPYSYSWVSHSMKLAKGPATVRVVVTGAAPERRSVDAVVLTTDAAWKPVDRGYPPMAYSEYLTAWGKERPHVRSLVKAPAHDEPPQAWRLPITAGRDYWYVGAQEFIPGFPKPLLIREDPQGSANYARNFGANPAKAPIFGAPECAVKYDIKSVADLLKADNPMRRYLIQHKLPFVLSGNYASAGAIPNSYAALKQTFGDQWLGIVSGEGTYLGLPVFADTTPFGPQYKETNYSFLFGEGKSTWKQMLERDWASSIPNPFENVILCSSVGTLSNIHRLAEAGGQVLGTESAAAMPYMPLQAAFARGAARQYGRRWMWYYGASFGDAIRTFTKEGQYILDLEGMKIDNKNATIGPSLPHIRRVLLHSYLQGASLFYPEQGYNLIGSDGNLNPMGWCYDETIRLAARHPDRGVTYTPVGVLLDRAHGWEKYDYAGMHIWERQALERSDRMVDGFFNVTYYPFPRNEGKPADDLGVCWPNGYFGDVFDVLVTSPTRMDVIKSYPVLFCVGDTRLDAKWAAALKDYVNGGGTLVINAEQVVPGLDEAFLGATLGKGTKEASSVTCQPDGEVLASTVFPYREATPTSAKVVAATDKGDPIAMVNRVGKGSVILTTPSYLLGYDLQPTPYMARLLLHVTSGLLPVRVRGNCEHYVNLHPKGYVVVLSNNEGITKLSHSAATMDASKVSDVELSMKAEPRATEDWLGEEPQTWSFPNEWLPEYTQPIKVNWTKNDDRYTATVKLRPGEIRAFLIHTK